MQIKYLSTIFAIVVLAIPVSASATTIFLTSGSSWTVPSDWNASNNQVRVIGGGGEGGVGYYCGGGAGGGGAYSAVSNLTLTPGASVSYSVGGGGSSGGYGASGGNTWFNGTSISSASVSAQGGIGGTNGSTSGCTYDAGGSGGLAANGIGITKYSGGTGGASAYGGGGGGGAAGPSGPGGNGGSYGGGAQSGGGGGGGANNGAAGQNNSANNVSGGAGGNDGYSGTGGAAPSCVAGTSGGGGSGGYAGSCGGGAGGSDTAFDGSHGSGGGGGGAAAGTVWPGQAPGFRGGAGGLYGGGGSGGATYNTIGNSGAQGIIVITYTPALPSASRNLTVNDSVSVAGNVTVTANLAKGSGTFLIDHPVDPANKLLYHSFVESPDALNEYVGTAIIGRSGDVTIRLPDYFEALNGDPQYFIRALDMPMPNLFVKQEVNDNKFVVGGGAPGGEISWMVTGIRHDPYILANPIVPEVDKGPDQLVDKGEYVFEGNAPACSTLVGCAWQFFVRLF